MLIQNSTFLSIVHPLSLQSYSISNTKFDLFLSKLKLCKGLTERFMLLILVLFPPWSFHCHSRKNTLEECFLISTFKFQKYIYEIWICMWQPAYFLLTLHNEQPEKIHKWWDQMHIFHCYSSSNINCHSIPGYKKKIS